MDDDEIWSILDSYYQKDRKYESGKILGSMYSTPPEIVLRVFFKFYQANLGNPGLYPGTVEMEREVIKFLNRLVSGSSGHGQIVSGGTEANIIALWAARNMGYRRILTTADAHFSIRKAADILSIPILEIPMRNYVMDVDAIGEELRDGDVVVLTAGITATGLVDPVAEVGKVCEEVDCYLHVDAAFGGFVLPFIHPDIKFGFDVPAVRSVTIDPHKMGLAPYPAGGILAREDIFSHIETDAPYLTGGKNRSLLGTRQSGSVAAAYAAILHFGWEGYGENARRCMHHTGYLVRRAREEGFEILVGPLMNIVNLKLSNIVKIKDALFRKGWTVSTNPGYSSLRIVVMPHVTEEVIDSFLNDLKNIKNQWR